MCKRFAAPLSLLVGLAVGTIALAQDNSKGVRLSGTELSQMVDPAVIQDGYNVLYSVWFNVVLRRQGSNWGEAMLQWVDRFGLGGQHKGKWRIDGDALCTTFPGAPVSDEQCRYHYRLGDGVIEQRSPFDGSLVSVYRPKQTR